MLRLLFLISIVQAVIMMDAFAESLGVLLSRTDWSCVQLEPTGRPCRRLAPPFLGVQMRYRQPVLIVETVKNPGDTAINEFRVLTGEPLRRMAEMSLQTPSGTMDSGSSSSADTTALQMNDVHVFGFPATDTFSTMIEPVCEGSPDLVSPVSYLSEMDAVEWRTLRNESRNPMSLLSQSTAPMCDRSGALTPGMCIGVWGPMYPRGGFSMGYSPVVGSGVAAYRGVDLASANILSLSHQRTAPLLFVPDMFWDRMQLVYPSSSGCIRIGEDPSFWEQGRVSEDGKYVWVYWRKKECCAL